MLFRSVDAGADAAAVPIWGITPLQTAIYHGSRQAVDVLVARTGLLPDALYVAAAGLYTVLALHSPLPVLFPDEFRYSHLARSLAGGHGFDWRGEHVGQSAALYVYFITPAWALFQSSVDAYHASKVLGTLVLCAQVVPVWLLARELVGPRLALIGRASCRERVSSVV